MNLIFKLQCGLNNDRLIYDEEDVKEIQETLGEGNYFIKFPS